MSHHSETHSIQHQLYF